MAEDSVATDSMATDSMATTDLGVDITPNKDGGVMKLVKKEGSAEFGHAMTGDKVSVHYVGTLMDGTKFDSSRDRSEYFTFTLGKGEVIKAWDIGVASMTKGELCVLTCKSEYAYGENGSPPKIPAGATLIFEVELFEWKGEDLSEDKDGGILRSTIDSGSGYSSPTDGAVCQIHMTGRCAGKQFDDRDVNFILGEGEEHNIVPGVEEALKKFKKGEKSQLKIQSKYAFGEAGNEQLGVPSGADVEYDVTLTTFEKCKEAWEMDAEEKLEQSNVSKQKGTDFFKRGNFTLAIRYYGKIVKFLEEEDESSEDKDKRQELLLAAYLNMAMCHLKMLQNTEAKEQCDKALKLDADNVKGFFRRGSALMNTQNYKEAVKDFNQVLKLDPTNKAAKNQITLADAKLKQEKEKEKKLYSGMFQKFADQDAKKEKANEKPMEIQAEHTNGTEDAKKEEANEKPMEIEAEHTNGTEETTTEKSMETSSVSVEATPEVET